MPRPIKDLSKARILVTNDDGIHAPGLKLLEKIARTLSDDVWVVAPEVEQSGAGHSLSIAGPVRFYKHTARKYAVIGTPTDCVLCAVRAIIPDDKPVDLVLSGINRGANIGEDITHSGTVAAALEGTLCEIPSIAFSQAFSFWDDKIKVNWETAEAYAAKIIRQLTKAGWPSLTLMNVNFPDVTPAKVKGLKVVPHGRRDTTKKLTEMVDPKGRKHYWINWADEGIDPAREDCDLKWIKKGYVTITPIRMDLTDYQSLAAIRKSVTL